MTFKPFPLLVSGLAFMIFFASCKKEIINNEVPVAEAGDSQTIQITEDASSTKTTLTGIGTDADGSVVGYIWSQVSGPNGSQIVNPGSSTTEVRGLVTGKYLFQLMVVDNDGATGVDTVGVTVKGPNMVTLLLQPAKNPNEVTIWGNNSGAEQSDPNAVELGAVAWTAGDQVGMRSAFAFDFSSIPSNAKITSALLTLYSNHNPLNGDHINANSGTNNSMYIQRNTTAWTAQTVKWTNQPSTTTTNQVSIPHTSQSFLDLVDVDVKKLVEDMLTNGNYGFNIRLQNEAIYNSRIFYSSKSSVTQKFPKLVIVYTTN